MATLRTLILAGASFWFAGHAVVAVAEQTPAKPKPRILVLTDIGNEPDDSESFVRFLLYSNELDIEGLVATTSTWQRNKVQPALLKERVEAYGKVLANLRQHARGYPDADTLMKLIRSGSPVYGMQGVGEGKDTDATRLIIAAADRADTRPLWIPVWGGAADLAQALWTVRATRTPDQVRAFVAKLRVYSISDQDDAGPWARRNFPDLFWIASVHGFGQYGMAAWTGISGDLLGRQKWPNLNLVTNEWLAQNIRKGPLGSLYPPHQFIMEGDTPSFLGLIPNGLNEPEHPEWGGWGGRYTRSDESAAHRGDTQDTYVDADGTTWNGNQATIFRWRHAFQRDFAARIQWSLTSDPKQANHNPAVVLNGIAGRAPVSMEACTGTEVALTAEGSHDPDGNSLSYRWWQYPEPTGRPGLRVPMLTIQGAHSTRASFMAPGASEALTYHVILEITDNGSPALVSYRRALVTVNPCDAQT
jgi:hypothetical protein